jgi:hypothetical protein
MSDQTRVALERRHEISWTDSHLRPDKFQTISFARARFDGEVDFSGRIFAADADFINARFYYPPDFDTATNHARIDLTGARVGFVPEGKWIHWTKNSRIPVRFRSFRKLAEETKNHDLERDLYIEERKAERGVYLCHRWEALKKEGWKNTPRNLLRLAIHGFWIFIMFLYWALADYGRNVVVHFLWWLAFTFLIFPRLYAAILDPLMREAGLANTDKYNHAVSMLAFGNAVPFVGPLTIDAEIKIAFPCRRRAFNSWWLFRTSFPSSSCFSSASRCVITSGSSEAVSAIPFQTERRLHPMRIAINIIAQLQLT